jgi:tRNA-specific 2-thiouridylase
VQKNKIEVNGETMYQLLAGADNKPVLFSLSIITTNHYSYWRMTKPEVREIAEMELVTAEKKDSQGLCFIGKVRLPEFCNKKLQPKESIIQIEKTMRYIQMKSMKGV